MSRRAGRNHVQTQSQTEPTPSTSSASAVAVTEPDDLENPEDEDLTDPALLAVRYGMKNVIELVEDLIPNCETDEQKEMMKTRLQTLMLQFIKSDMSYMESEKIVDAVAEENPPDETPVTENDTDLAVDKLTPIVNERVKAYEDSLTEATLKAHSKYQSLLREFQKYERTEVEEEPETVLEESILAEDSTSEHITTIDPITKQKLTDPVRNCRCKHIYGRAAILQLIKKNPKIRCPMMGCSNIHFLKARDLSSDPKLTAAVLKKQAEQAAEEED